MSRIRTLCLLFLVALTGAVALAEGDAAKGKPGETGKSQWRTLFDGKTLAGWKSTQFGANGEPEVQDGQIILPAGDPLTGVNREKDDVPHVNYEVAFEARRVEGSDFFVGFTFPVEKSFASLILGGWAGSVCGISSIDHMDASENSTSSFHSFKNGQWYKVRVRVLKDRLEAWLDDEQIVDADIAGKKISTRVEVDASKPFGFCSYRTKAALRNIRLHELTPDEVKAAEKGDEQGEAKDAKDKAAK
jgi:hypothetical protein